MQVQELRELDAEELSGRLKGARRELFELRFKLAVGQLDNPQQIKTVRHEIARILTIVHERLLDEQVNEAYADVEPVATLPVEEAPAEEEAPPDSPHETPQAPSRGGPEMTVEDQEDTPEEVESPEVQAPAEAEDESETEIEDQAEAEGEESPVREEKE